MERWIAAGVGALATLALEGLGTAAAGTLAAVAEQGVAGEPLCLPCAVKAGGVAGALTVLTLGAGRVPAVQRFAGRLGAWLGETRAGQWATRSIQVAAKRVGLSRGGTVADAVTTTSAEVAPVAERPLFAPKLPRGTREPGSIPGKPTRVENAAPPLPEGWAASYDLSVPEADDALQSFSGPPTPDVLPHGTRLYRIVGEGNNPAGGFWTTMEPPAIEADWRAGWAVQGQWNGDGAYVEHTVGVDGLRVWRGPAAPQEAGADGWYLPGGHEQIFLPPNTITPSVPRRTPWNP